MANAFCSNCGNPIAPGVRFCTGCGSPVVAQAVESTPPVPPLLTPSPPPAQVDKYGFPIQAGRNDQHAELEKRHSLPMPPRLHWFLVGLFGLLTCGIFTVVWYFIQTGYAKRIDSRSNATIYMALALLCYLVYIAATLGTLSDDLVVIGGAVLLQLGMGLVGLVLFYCAFYSMAQSLENELPKFGLRPEIGGITLFFFSIFYLQGQLTWVARWKDSGRKDPPPPKGIFWLLGLGIPALLLVLALLLGISGAAFQEYLDRAQQMGASSVQQGADPSDIWPSADTEKVLAPATAPEDAAASGTPYPYVTETAPQQSVPTQNPSFSCDDTYRLNPSERAICGDADLAALDRSLGNAYRDELAGAQSDQRGALKRDQARWITTRNACGSDSRCIADSMRQRHLALIQWSRQAQDMRGNDEDVGAGTKRSDAENREASVDVTSKNMNPPRYPPAAARAGIEGSVVLVIDVDGAGNVTNVVVENSSRNRDLDRAAMEAARTWKFNSAVVDGQAASGRIRVPVDFNMGN
ncbi:TonB family protein [Pseudoxanthomonas japonensis]|nr:TonB family protein [Pseudoxanthomonas japonensis]